MANLSLVDLEDRFHKLSTPPIIANTLPMQTEEDRQLLNTLVFTHYDGESLKLTPSCECGKIKAQYRVGEICPHCNTECSTKYAGDIESIIWIECPDNCYKFITPIVWLMLNKTYRVSGFEIIKYLCDPYYRPGRRIPKEIQMLQEKGHKRGYAYFVRNFKQIIYDLSYKSNGKLVSKRYAEIVQIVEQNFDKIFTKMLPIPNKTVMVLESNGSDRYFDKNLFPAIDNVILATELGKMTPEDSITRYEAKVVKIIEKASEFLENFSSKILTGKRGIFRKHYFAIRPHFTARQVITSLHEPHQADELHIPWTGAVKMFTEHLRSILLKPPYNFGLNEVNDKIRFAINNYDELIDKLLTKIIKEDTPYKGFPCLFSRPPILTRGSIQFFYITDYLKDPDINTVKLSPLVLVMPNADFDGDSMHITLLLGKNMHDAFKIMAPVFTILDPDNPNQLSGAIKLHTPVIATINNWFLETDLKLKELQNGTANPN